MSSPDTTSGKGSSTPKPDPDKTATTGALVSVSGISSKESGSEGKGRATPPAGGDIATPATGSAAAAAASDADDLAWLASTTRAVPPSVLSRTVDLLSNPSSSEAVILKACSNLNLIVEEPSVRNFFVARRVAHQVAAAGAERPDNVEFTVACCDLIGNFLHAEYAEKLLAHLQPVTFEFDAVVEYLASVVKRHLANDSVRKAAFKCLSLLSDVRKCLPALSATGVAELAVESLTRYPTDLTSCLLASATLVGFAQNPDGQSEYVTKAAAAGAIPVLVDTLKLYCEDVAPVGRYTGANVACECCAAIAEFSCGGPSTPWRPALVRARPMEPIVRALSRFPEHSRLVFHACPAIVLLCGDGDEEPFLQQANDFGAPAAVMTSLRVQFALSQGRSGAEMAAQAMQNCLLATVQLAEHPTNQATFGGPSGILPLLADIVKLFPHDARSISALTKVVQRLAHTSSNADAIISAGLVPSLLPVITKLHAKFTLPGIRVSACAIVGELARSKPGHEAVINPPVMNFVLAVFEASLPDAESAASLLLAIMRMSKTPVSAGFIAGSTALSKVVHALQRHISDTLVAMYGCAVLASIAHHCPDGPAACARVKAVPAILALLNHNIDNPDVSKAACGALDPILVSSFANCKLAVNADGIPLLLSVLARHPSDIRAVCPACSSLVHIARELPNCKQMQTATAKHGPLMPRPDRAKDQTEGQGSSTAGEGEGAGDSPVQSPSKVSKKVKKGKKGKRAKRAAIAVTAAASADAADAADTGPGFPLMDRDGILTLLLDVGRRHTSSQPFLPVVLFLLSYPFNVPRAYVQRLSCLIAPLVIAGLRIHSSVVNVVDASCVALRRCVDMDAFPGMQPADSLPLIMDAAKRHLSSPSVVIAAAELVTACCKTDGAKEALSDRGVLGFLLEAAQAHTKHPRPLERIWHALRSMFAFTRNKQPPTHMVHAFEHADGPRIAVDVVNSDLRDPPYLADVCHLVGSLCLSGENTTADIFIKHGIIESLLARLDRAPDSERVGSLVLEALARVTSARLNIESARRVVQAGAVTKVLAAIKRHPDKFAEVSHACELLVLALGRSAGAHRQLEAAEGVDILASVLCDFPISHPGVVFMTRAVALLISGSAEHRARLAAAGAVVTSVDVVRHGLQSRLDPWVDGGCCLLSSFTLDSGAARQAVEAGAIHLLKETVIRAVHAPRTVEAALAALGNLAYFDEYRAIIFEMDVVRPILFTLRAHFGPNELVENGLAALKNLALRNPTACSSIIDDGALGLVSSIFSLDNVCSTLLEECCLLLYNLAMYTNDPTAITDGLRLQHIVNILILSAFRMAHITFVPVAAWGALAAFAVDKRNRAEMGKHEKGCLHSALLWLESDHSEDPVATAAALHLLAQLAADCPNNARLIREADGPRTILEAVVRHLDFPKVTQVGLVAFINALGDDAHVPCPGAPDGLAPLLLSAISSSNRRSSPAASGDLVSPLPTG